MKCLSPVKILNPDYEIKGFKGDKFIYVPCGKCESCIINDSSEWRIRLSEEFSNSFSAVFVTLTYNDSNLPYKEVSVSDVERKKLPCVSKSDCQKFFKRLRSRYYKEFPEYQNHKLRYFLVSEYGPTTLRPHYHCIIFNLFPPFKSNTIEHKKVTDFISEIWTLGFVKVDHVNENRIGYVVKYMSCVLSDVYEKNLIKPFRLMSRKPGIGSSYFDKIDLISWHKDTLSNYYPKSDFKLRLPKYYKSHIFSKDEYALIRDKYLNRLTKDEKFRYLNLSKPGTSEFYNFANKHLALLYSYNSRIRKRFKLKYIKNRKDV